MLIYLRFFIFNLYPFQDLISSLFNLIVWTETSSFSRSDPRNNSGGLVSSGIAVADSLLSDKPVVETKNRNGIKDAIISQKETSFDGPMVTLVNKGTASASEILAGSLQDNERSILMGEKTYGKGLIQSLKSLGEDSGIAITVASYLTVSYTHLTLPTMMSV